MKQAEVNDRYGFLVVVTEPESGIIIGGSSHAVYEKLPWMARLQEFIKAMVYQQKPTLGVCFGHQIVAAALGGTVEKGAEGREFGPTQVMLTPEGQADVELHGRAVLRNFAANFVEPYHLGR